MFPKQRRISQSLFKTVLKEGRSFRSPHLSLRVLPCARGSRFAVVVPKKIVRMAAARNKLRRRALSVLRRKFSAGATGFSAAVFLGSGADKLSFADLCAELDGLFRRAGLH